MDQSAPVERLETRQLRSATLEGGVLRAVGDPNAANTITVGLGSDPSFYNVTINGTTVSFPSSGVSRIMIHGGNLNDSLTLVSTLAKRQSIFGYGGNDTIKGLAPMKGAKPGGWVRLWGEEGNDVITSTGGRASIDGGPGSDKLIGSGAADIIAGFTGNDTIYGQSGADTLSGGEGNDKILGGDGIDKIDAGGGDDIVFGGAGGDIISGGTGSDTLVGEDGSDSLDGGVGMNVLFGNGGDDVLYGASALDTLVGGTGTDALSDKAGSLKVQASTPALDAQAADLELSAKSILLDI